jgi:predicted phosphodiesterase
MKIQILSDLHLEGGISYLLNDFKPVGDVLVLAGDITSARAKGQIDKVFGQVKIPVIYVLGNHEYYGGLDQRLEFDRYVEWVKDFPNFHVVDGESVKITVGDETIYFVGSTYWSEVSPLEELDVKRCIADFSAMNNRSVAMHNGAHMWAKGMVPVLVDGVRLNDPDAKIVVVTHFPPSYQAQEERFKGRGSALSSYFYNNEDLLVERVNPNLWVYGHTHGNLKFKCGDVPVVTNQMGYMSGNFDGLKGEPCFKEFDVNYTVEV